MCNGLIEADWWSTRESWHARAHQSFPGKTTDYWNHIYAAERALASKGEQRKLMDESEGTEYRAWYGSVFELATELGLQSPAKARGREWPAGLARGFIAPVARNGVPLLGKRIPQRLLEGSWGETEEGHSRRIGDGCVRGRPFDQRPRDAGVDRRDEADPVR